MLAQRRRVFLELAQIGMIERLTNTGGREMDRRVQERKDRAASFKCCWRPALRAHDGGLYAERAASREGNGLPAG
jgi:hypothetical protein